MPVGRRPMACPAKHVWAQRDLNLQPGRYERRTLPASSSNFSVFRSRSFTCVRVCTRGFWRITGGIDGRPPTAKRPRPDGYAFRPSSRIPASHSFCTGEAGFNVFSARGEVAGISRCPGRRNGDVSASCSSAATGTHAANRWLLLAAPNDPEVSGGRRGVCVGIGAKSLRSIHSD